MKISTEAKIGFIVLATIALVIFGINYLKGKNVLKRTDVYYAVFNDIFGLKQSGNIYISGMKVGVINDIDFNRHKYNEILVALAVNKGITIPKNSVIELFSADLMGNRALRILPSSEKAAASYGDTLSSRVELDMLSSLKEELTPLTDEAKRAMISLDSLISALNSILDPNSQIKLRQIISALQESTSSLAVQLKPEGKLSQTIDNLEAFTKILSNNKEKLNTVFLNMQEITDSVAKSNLKNVISNMDKTFNQTQQLLLGINEGKGSLGLLATSDSLYNNLESATANLAILLDDLKNNPKRYVHFSIFGNKDKKQSK